jgi:hypothetical protein
VIFSLPCWDPGRLHVCLIPLDGRRLWWTNRTLECFCRVSIFKAASWLRMPSPKPGVPSLKFGRSVRIEIPLKFIIRLVGLSSGSRSDSRSDSRDLPFLSTDHFRILPAWAEMYIEILRNEYDICKQLSCMLGCPVELSFESGWTTYVPVRTISLSHSPDVSQDAPPDVPCRRNALLLHRCNHRRPCHAHTIHTLH